MKRIFNLILLGVGIVLACYLINSKSFFNYEISVLKSAIFEKQQALESIK